MSMALSYCSNWQQRLNQETTSIFWQPPPPPELPPELFSFHDNFTFSDTCINPLFETNAADHQLIISSNCSSNNYMDTNLLTFDTNMISYPMISSYSEIDHLDNQQVFAPLLDLETSGYTHEDPFSYSSISTCPFVPNLCDEQQLLLGNFVAQLQPELPPLPEIYQEGVYAAPLFPWYDSGHENINPVEVKKQNSNGGGGGGSLSAQSVAARVRRRKISEKTQELGKLIPGGHKMNTAEMFQAAFKYIKYLQAQVNVVKLIPSIPGSEEALERGEFQALVTCPSIQEKLYTSEKCIAPKHFEEIIGNYHNDSQLSKER